MDLEQARKQINDIDKQIIELFEKRMHAVADIATFKHHNNMSIFQPDRETEIINANLQLLDDVHLKPYAQKMLTYLMEISKSYQSHILNLENDIKKLPVKKYGLLGEKLAHSLSPRIHDLFFGITGIKASYVLNQVPKNRINSIVESIKALDMDGVNVTIPYKENVIPQLDKISEEAQKIGAVNTIKIVDDKAFGYNTDYFGIGQMLSYGNIPVEDNDFYILGSGGSAKSVICYLIDNNAAEIVLVTRNKEKALKQFANLNSDIIIIDYNEFEDVRESYCVINTTPVGMFPNIDDSPIDEDKIKCFGCAVDLIYNPIETKFLYFARTNGLKTVNGLYMLVAQAIKAQEIWQERIYPSQIITFIYKQIENLLQVQRQSFYLIGFMGSGKTTIGRLLAELLEMPFLDIDEYIEMKTQKTISEIFETDGEQHFRTLELEALEQTDDIPRIFATGGGILTYQPSREYLEDKNCIYLKNDIEILYDRIKDDSNRPLVDSIEKLTERLQEREEAYEKVSSLTIDTKDLSVFDISKQIMKQITKLIP